MAKKSQLEIAIEKVQREIDVLEQVQARLIAAAAREPAKRIRIRKPKRAEVETSHHQIKQVG